MSLSTRSDGLTQGNWLAFPSWLLSCLFHVGLAATILSLSQLPSCQRDMAGDEGDSFREVGIHLRENSPNPEPQSEEHTAESPPLEINPFTKPMVQPLADQPPVDLKLPDMKLPPIVGAGPAPSLELPVGESKIKPSTTALNEGSLLKLPKNGGTSFLGIDDVGKKFVYVIDRSYSMETDNALQAAKAELLTSLQRLDETQQFQIIFYHNDLIVLESRDGDYFWGSDAQRLQVSEQIRAVFPKGGTRHMPALMRALSLEPDVIFLLTDGAAEQALTGADFEQIRARNRGRARIHCIEFGRSATPPSDAGNFLKRLAKENGGNYLYRNVSRS